MMAVDPRLVTLLVHVAIAVATVLVLTPFVRRVAIRTGAVARPKLDRWHRQTIPMLGGVSIFAGVAASMAAAGLPSREALPVLIVGAGMFALGLLDDLIHLRPGGKLAGQIAVACA